MRLSGETRNDYFWIVCQDCGEHVRVRGFGWDGGVPKVVYECESDGCRKRGTQFLKLLHRNWLDVSDIFGDM